MRALVAVSKSALATRLGRADYEAQKGRKDASYTLKTKVSQGVCDTLKTKVSQGVWPKPKTANNSININGLPIYTLTTQGVTRCPATSRHLRTPPLLRSSRGVVARWVKCRGLKTEKEQGL